MQGGRSNVGSRTVNTSGRMAARLHNPAQTPSTVARPKPARPPVGGVDHDAMIAQGQATGTPAQTIAPPSPVHTPSGNESVSPNTGQHRPSGPGTGPVELNPGIKQ